MLAGTGFEHGKLAKLPHAALGSALGLALGFVLKLMMGSSLGESGGYVFGALALTVVFCHILGWMSLIVNFSCMTFLATITIRSAARRVGNGCVSMCRSRLWPYH